MDSEREASNRYREVTSGKPTAYIRGVRTLCGPDCDPKEGFHVPDYERCQRCGSLIHKRLIDIDHPTYGSITVGSECVKEVLGWKWTKSHEQALETQQVFDERLVAQGTLWTEVTKLKSRVLVNEHLRGQGVGLRLALRYCRIDVPHGWVERLWRAAMDLQLPWITKADPFEPPPRGWPDAVGVSGADPDAYNWTAVLPGYDRIYGGQSPTLDSAERELRENLTKLLAVARETRFDYSPRGGIWNGPRELIDRVKMSLYGDLVHFERGRIF